MNLRSLLSKKTIGDVSRFCNSAKRSLRFSTLRNATSTSGHFSASLLPPLPADTELQTPVNNILPMRRYFHSSPESNSSAAVAVATPATSDSEEGEDAMNEFLSRFVYIMRGKLVEAFPGCDKDTINGMLLVIVEKVVEEVEKGNLEKMVVEAGTSTSSPSSSSLVLSEDLWKTVWEVSGTVCREMEKERKKEKMKKFLQSEEVKTMAKFASEVGIRGDMLREFKFKWAREKMEESEFYDELEQMREEDKKEEAEQKTEGNNEEDGDVMPEEHVDEGGEEQGKKIVDLPKRKGKIKYKIYGLDLSSPKWKEVADKIHEAGEMIWPAEAKPITGKCKVVTEKILSLGENDDPSSLVAEWLEMLQPNKVDWLQLLEKLKERNLGSYYKLAEHVLGEPSFQADIRDLFKLMDEYAKANRLEDSERILKMMEKNGLQPDVLTLSAIVQMYSKAGKLDRAKEAFEKLRGLGFKPDMQVFSCMIMAYIKAGDPRTGELLMREMEAKGIKPTKEILMALLRAYAQKGDTRGAHAITTTMQFAGFQPTLESCTLLVEVYTGAGDAEQARFNFDYIDSIGLKPDDRCVASMLTAYENRNSLDMALDLLLQQEKDGFEPGVATYTVLVDWFGKLQLVDEAEKMLDKITRLGEAPPFKIQVSLCEMYSRAKMEKKSLQTLGVLEAKKEQLSQADFERVIRGLIDGGFKKDAQRMFRVMENSGFKVPEQLKVAEKSSVFFAKSDGRSRMK